VNGRRPERIPKQNLWELTAQIFVTDRMPFLSANQQRQHTVHFILYFNVLFVANMPNKTYQLTDNNFIQRMLYLDSY